MRHHALILYMVLNGQNSSIANRILQQNPDLECSY
ncbi:MAG: hypothetical protein CM1200mP20_09590 [Pseudomonadota bacterium]|nr:MAG: hypothetical protein CM1200mP20_09590 [Pseudomonadota bacterium]